MSLEDMVAELAKYRGVIAAEYKWLIKSYKWEPDLRSGEETYGYESRESIRDNLFYISDRWIAQFRLRWVLDLIDRGIGD